MLYGCKSKESVLICRGSMKVKSSLRLKLVILMN